MGTMGNMFGYPTTGPITAPTAASTGTGTAPASTLLSGTVGSSDPNDTNYGGSGMTRAAYYAKYGDPNQQGAAAEAAAHGATVQGNNAANNPAINPTLASASTVTAPSTAPPTYGTNSGPGILQQWFNERANGTDPGYEYTTGRGLKALDTAAAARGGFNGGASMQQDSDYLANMGAQREGQLDALAGGASNENANQISQMFGLGMGLGGGEAGTAGAYDTGAATDWTNANNTGLSLSGQAAMIPYLARQQMMSQLMGGGMGVLSSLLG